MKNRTDLSSARELRIPATPRVEDVEKPHPTVADFFGPDQVDRVQQVRLGDIWSDFIRAAGESRDPDAPSRHDGAVPFLDDMTGIRQWE